MLKDNGKISNQERFELELEIMVVEEVTPHDDWRDQATKTGMWITLVVPADPCGRENQLN